MCAVSAIADDWRHRNPNIIPSIWTTTGPSREEFEALRVELNKVKEELKKAKQQDIDEGNPDCEMEEKIEIFRKLGKMVGIDFDEVFGNAG